MVHVHGIPGQSLREEGAERYGRVAIRAGFIEQVTARALERWLSGRPDSAGLHLFHDLRGFRDVSGHGFGPVGLGTANIDHVVLSGAGWLLLDAKATAAGTLTIDDRGRGVLIGEDGTCRPEPWLDSAKTHSAAGILVRLTGMRGCAVWVTPDATKHDPDVLRARAFRYGGTICTIGAAADGSLGRLLPVPQPPADPDIVAALAQYVSALPDVDRWPDAGAS